MLIQNPILNSIHTEYKLTAIIKGNDALQKKSRLSLKILEVVLICLTVFFVVVSISLVQAKFIKDSHSDENAGNVAQYVLLSSPSTSKELTIDCRTDKTKATWTVDYPFSVSNTKDGKTSDVSIIYEIMITIPSELVDGVELSLNCNNTTLTPKQSTSTIFLFDGYSQFEAGNANSHSYTLTFTVDATVVVNIFELNEININIDSRQVD